LVPPAASREGGTRKGRREFLQDFLLYLKIQIMKWEKKETNLMKIPIDITDHLQATVSV